MVKSIVSLSGGMDSATVLAVALDQGREVEAVGFTYGSKHNKYENEAARLLADCFDVPFRLIDLAGITSHLQSNLLKSGGEIPEGYYEAESMKQTVVPGRNLIFTSILAGIAWSIGAEEVWLGIHAGDHFIYPDCRPAFFTAMRDAVEQGTGKRVTLQAPFLHETKVEILQIGFNLELPYHLTRTCYKDQPVACGRCGACQERLTAFAALGADDPIEYESRVLTPKG